MFPLTEEIFTYKRKNVFLLREEIFIISSLTEEIFVHIYLHYQEKTLFYCDCANSR